MAVVTFGALDSCGRVADNLTLTVNLIIIIDAAVVGEARIFADRGVGHQAGTSARGVPENTAEVDPSECVGMRPRCLLVAELSFTIGRYIRTEVGRCLENKSRLFWCIPYVGSGSVEL